MSNYQYAATQGREREAAFQLHQATERFYHCVFLVRTLYSPKTHNLNRLRALTEQLEPTLRAVWPVNERGQKRAYNLLREAYIKARYSREYKITSEDINWLIERASVLEPEPKVVEQYQHVVIHASLRRDGVNGDMDWYCPARA